MSIREALPAGRLRALIPGPAGDSGTGTSAPDEPGPSAAGGPPPEPVAADAPAAAAAGEQTRNGPAGRFDSALSSPADRAVPPSPAVLAAARHLLARAAEGALEPDERRLAAALAEILAGD